MQRTLTCQSEGAACAGTVFVPALLPSGTQAPGIIPRHGFACAKEIILHPSIQTVVDAGFVALTVDNRFLGSYRQNIVRF